MFSSKKPFSLLLAATGGVAVAMMTSGAVAQTKPSSLAAAPVTQVAASSSAGSAQTLILRFSAIAQEQTSVWQDAPTLLDGDETDVSQAPAPSQPRIQAGDQLTTSDLMQLLQQSPAADQMPATAMFGASDLTVFFENTTTGEVYNYALAQCDSLSFESAGGGIFEQQVQCGADRFGYGVTLEGVEITRNGLPYMSLALAPGMYQLDAVPFRIDPR